MILISERQISVSAEIWEIKPNFCHQSVDKQISVPAENFGLDVAYKIKIPYKINIIDNIFYQRNYSCKFF